MKIIPFFIINFITTLSEQRFYYFYDSNDRSAFDKYENKEYFNFGKFRGVILDEDKDILDNDTSINGYQYIQDSKVKLIDVFDLKTKDKEENLWGLDRINQRNNDLDYEFHNQNVGSGVDVYVIDSGIEINHDILKYNSYMLKDYTKDEDNVDYNGHGTHVSGIIGGRKYGVANNVKMYGLKVFDSSGSGSTLDIIRAMYEVLKRCIHKNKKCVVNMSLGGPYQQIYNDMINDMMLHNIIVVVAAGNSNMDACKVTPAAAYLAVTVGATDPEDKKAKFSNYGNCVNIYAPGVGILSSYKYNSYRYLSGTSMATPFISGIVSKLWGENPEYNSFEVVDKLYESSTFLIHYYEKYNAITNKTEITTRQEKFSYIEDKKFDLNSIFNYNYILVFSYWLTIIYQLYSLLKIIFKYLFFNNEYN